MPENTPDSLPDIPRPAWPPRPPGDAAPEDSAAADAPETPTPAPEDSARERARERRSQIRFLPQHAALEEAETPGFLRGITFGIFGLVALAILWSAMARIDELSVGPGEIVPMGHALTVQHLEGGIVREILVNEGDLVAPGQPLLQLDSSQSLAELEEARAHEAALAARAGRLREFADGVPGGANGVGGMAPRSGDRAALIPDQQEILVAQQQARLRQREILEAQAGQRQAGLERLESEESSLRRQLAIVEEARDMRQTLFDRGRVSRVALLDAEQQVETVRHDLDSVSARIPENRQALVEAETRLADLDARLRSEAMTERGLVTAELAQVREQIVRLEDRVDRLLVRAAARGYIKGLDVNTVGGVVGPGAVLMEIVPVDPELVVEARVSTRDVGHIRPGLPAIVKVDTYDFARFGAIAGTVESISATTFLDGDGRPYYRAVIRPDNAWVGAVPGRQPLAPGMTVSAEIVTGDRSVLQYMLNPVWVALNDSFRER